MSSVFWKRFGVLCGLSAIGVTVPVLDLYGANPEVFVANGAAGWEVFLFGVIIVSITPAICFILLWAATNIGERAALVTYLLLLAVLSITSGLVVARQVVDTGFWLFLLVVLGVVGLIVAVHRYARSLLIWAATLLPVSLAMFAGLADVSSLVWSAPDTGVSASIGAPADLVVIQLDEMPLASIVDLDGTVNEALFPSFARLADEGTWYRNGLSSSIATTQSIPAILTGARFAKGLSPSYTDHPENLFSLLGEDYEMHVIEWVADMCPADICPDYAGRAPARFSSLLADLGVVYAHLVLPASMRADLPTIDNTWTGFLGQEADASGIPVEIEGLDVPEPAIRADWVDWIQRITNGIDASGRPTLSYTHVQAPHVPWVTNPSGTQYSRPEQYSEVEGVEGDGRWGPSPEPPLLGFQRHLSQIGMLDTMLGRLMDRMVETGTWDETMLVVVADHGASFVPGQHRRWPYEDNRDDLYRVPMFIKYPGQVTGETVDEPAFGIDILPTIVDTFDIETDLAFEGVSLADVKGTDRPHQPIWWCCSPDGASTDLQVLFDQVARNHQWVPDQTSWLGVAAGPLVDQAGSSIEQIAPVPAGDFLWQLDGESSLNDVDRSSGIVQTVLTGRATLPDDSGHRLAVVLNGRLAGSGYVVRDSPGGGLIRAIVSEAAVVDGHNEVVLLIEQAGGWAIGVAETVTLELRTPEGELLELRDEGSRRLEVSEVAPAHDGWRVSGWSADVSRKLTPDVIYVFAGADLVAYGPPNEDNANVVRWFESEDLLRSGFTFDLTTAQVPAGLERLTIVADFDGYAIADSVTITR